MSFYLYKQIYHRRVTVFSQKKSEIWRNSNFTKVFYQNPLKIQNANPIKKQKENFQSEWN